MKRHYLVEIITILFIILFTYTAVSKLSDFERFKITLARSSLFAGFSQIVAWGIPVIELLVSLLLVYPAVKLYGLYASFGLMVIFTSYVIYLLRSHERLPCTCGGIVQRMTWEQHLIFNIVFVVLAAVAVLGYPGRVERRK